MYRQFTNFFLIFLLILTQFLLLSCNRDKLIIKTQLVDSDGDGIYDLYDNCPEFANADQKDDNKNGIGDGCEDNGKNDGIKDDDKDGVEDSIDNCLDVNNPSQTDNDSDSVGDTCDNCPSTSNGNQLDTDGDKIGNLCDDDTTPITIDDDKDGVDDSIDKCLDLYSPSNKDSDNDGDGNECDNCPSVANSNQLDTDGDSKGDLCDQSSDPTDDPTDDPADDPTTDDDDDDGISDTEDNCPFISNPAQKDADGDNIGDVCDECIDDPAQNCDDPSDPTTDDDDGDGILDSEDNCPNYSNPDQDDTDGDNVGDLCDKCVYDPKQNCTDSDFDGITDGNDVCPNTHALTDKDNDCTVDSKDNCLEVANKDQADKDNDDSGDVCDNCIDTYNVEQKDKDNDGIGDACEATSGSSAFFDVRKEAELNQIIMSLTTGNLLTSKDNDNFYEIGMTFKEQSSVNNDILWLMDDEKSGFKIIATGNQLLNLDDWFSNNKIGNLKMKFFEGTNEGILLLVSDDESGVAHSTNLVKYHFDGSSFIWSDFSIWSGNYDKTVIDIGYSTKYGTSDIAVGHKYVGYNYSTDFGINTPKFTVFEGINGLGDEVDAVMLADLASWSSGIQYFTQDIKFSNIDSDSSDEIIVLQSYGTGGKLYAYNVYDDYFIKSGTNYYSTYSDHVDEIFIPVESGNILPFYTSYNLVVDDLVDTSAYLDQTAWGKNEIVTLVKKSDYTYSILFFAYNNYLKTILQIGYYDFSMEANPSISEYIIRSADLDGDGSKELVVAGVSSKGSLLWFFDVTGNNYLEVLGVEPVDANYPVLTDIAVGNVNNSQEDEIIISLKKADGSYKSKYQIFNYTKEQSNTPAPAPWIK